LPPGEAGTLVRLGVGCRVCPLEAVSPVAWHSYERTFLSRRWQEPSATDTRPSGRRPGAQQSEETIHSCGLPKLAPSGVGVAPTRHILLVIGPAVGLPIAGASGSPAMRAVLNHIGRLIRVSDVHVSDAQRLTVCAHRETFIIGLHEGDRLERVVARLGVVTATDQKEESSIRDHHRGTATQAVEVAGPRRDALDRFIARHELADPGERPSPEGLRRTVVMHPVHRRHDVRPPCGPVPVAVLLAARGMGVPPGSTPRRP
jgi:hypothetical protein